MTLVPATLVLIVGSELIRTNIDRWFNAPMGEILSSANQIASDYYQQRQAVLTDHAARIARALGDSRSHRRRRPADSRSAGAGSDAAARADARGVPRRAVERIAADAGAGGRRGRAAAAAGLQPRPGRPSGGPGDRRQRRNAIDRSARHLRRSAARGRRHPVERRARDRRRRGHRLPDRRARDAVAPHDARRSRATTSCASCGGR